MCLAEVHDLTRDTGITPEPGKNEAFRADEAKYEYMNWVLFVSGMVVFSSEPAGICISSVCITEGQGIHHVCSRLQGCESAVQGPTTDTDGFGVDVVFPAHWVQ